MTPAHFQDQIAWLKQHGRHFVSVDQVIAARAGKAPLPSDPVLVSVDDGFGSEHTTAFRVLQRYRVPAVFGLVGSWLAPESTATPRAIPAQPSPPASIELRGTTKEKRLTVSGCEPT